MAKMKAVPAAEFARNFGRYRMLAQRGAVPVSSHGQITGYFVPPDEFEEFERFRAQQQGVVTTELSANNVRLPAETRPHKD